MILKSWIPVFCGLKFKEIFKTTTINLNHIHQMVWSEKRFIKFIFMTILLKLADVFLANSKRYHNTTCISYNLSHCYNCNTILDYFLKKKWLILGFIKVGVVDLLSFHHCISIYSGIFIWQAYFSIYLHTMMHFIHIDKYVYQATHW